MFFFHNHFLLSLFKAITAGKEMVGNPHCGMSDGNSGTMLGPDKAIRIMYGMRGFNYGGTEILVALARLLRQLTRESHASRTALLPIAGNLDKGLKFS
jgi:hypothetical protein